MLTQADVDQCRGRILTNSTDIAALFGVGGFISWYNSTMSGHDPFLDRNGRPLSISGTAIVAGHFSAFWDAIPLIFGRPNISLVEFAALLCCSLVETNGDLGAAPENAPTLSYFFNAAPGKQSYNKNRDAASLLADPQFLGAHGSKAGVSAVMTHVPQSDWAGSTWPAGVSNSIDPAVNGFIMQADFYKFRGRGAVQTTWRENYKKLIAFLIDPARAWSGAANEDLGNLVDGWLLGLESVFGDQKIEIIATRSSEAEWTNAFAHTAVLAEAVRQECQDYFNFDRDVNILQAGPTPNWPNGSLGALPNHINGSSNGVRVRNMAVTMLSALAAKAVA